MRTERAQAATVAFHVKSRLYKDRHDKTFSQELLNLTPEFVFDE
jgi:hypothetical protein